MSKRLSSRSSILAIIGVLAVGLASVGLQGSPKAADQPSWGFDTANLDKTCKPCDDFYQFAMGGWMKASPIPPEYAIWGSFSQLADRNQKNLREILEAARSGKAPAGGNEQKISDFYASCMDATSIDAAESKPIGPEMTQIAAVATLADFEAETARLHKQGVGVLFRFNATQDAKDSSQVIGAALQGGLGLPEREYYLKQDEKSQKLREDYLKHVRAMLVLLGDSAEGSSQEAPPF